MKSYDNIVTFYTGSGLDTLAVNSSTPATPDGTEYIAELINQGMFGPQQDWMDYASLTPTGVIDIKGTSQIRDAIQLGNGIGPGMYVQYGKDDDPSVTGDRVILLSEQGVLISAYPDLDAATWIGGDTAAQVAAIAAGKKFYRSSDAAGTIGNAAGPYLQLPVNPSPSFLKEYSEADGDFTITGANWTTISAVAVPYKTTNGKWYLKFNILGDTSSTTASLALTFSGILTRAMTTSRSWRFSAGPTSAAISNTFVGSPENSNTLTITYSAVTNRFLCFGDIPLASKPTWADDFEIQWGITY